MDPRKTPEQDNEELEGPAIEQQDWDVIEGADILPDSVTDDDMHSDEEKDGELPDEDDDNAYQNSDEALPDDDEERALSGDLAGKGVRYEAE